MSDTLSVSTPGPPSRRPQRWLALVLECGRIDAGAARWSLAGIDRVELGRGDRRRARRSRVDGAQVLRIEVPDPRVSNAHARVVRIGGRFILEDLGSKNGLRVNHVAERRVALSDGDVVELGETFWRYHQAPAEVDEITDTDLAGSGADGVVFATVMPDLEQRLADLARLAPAPLSILIHGETGTGKELAARAVHRLSGRSGPFTAVNCGALSPTLLESELFGYRKGAFSGADEDRPGLVRAARGGTLFLDELGDLPLPAQAHLLRVIQEGEVLPVGATTPVPVDIRVVAATHRDVDAMTADGRFRSDLLARLAGFRVTIPPVRERLDDLGLLVGAALAEVPEEHRPAHLALEVARGLLRHDWPLNVRELQQCLWSAAALSPAGRLEAARLPSPVRERCFEAEPAPSDDEPDELRDELVRLLRAQAGNLAAVAREMGKDRTQIRRWLKRYNLDPDRYR